jgi:hypothetical protein
MRCRPGREHREIVDEVLSRRYPVGGAFAAAPVKAA